MVSVLWNHVDEVDPERVIAGHSPSAARANLEARHDHAGDGELDVDERYDALARRIEFAGVHCRVRVALLADDAPVDGALEPGEADAAHHSDLHAFAPGLERIELMKFEARHVDRVRGSQIRAASSAVARRDAGVHGGAAGDVRPHERKSPVAFDV